MQDTNAYTIQGSTAERARAEQDLRRFTRAWAIRDDRLAWASYLSTFIAYFGTLALAIWAWPSPWLVIPLIVVNAFAGVRLYVLQHDCGHGSLFERKVLNDLAGEVLSAFTLTPYRVMQANHNAHHAHLGNLDERETTEIFTMTTNEWNKADFRARLRYRIYRNPLIMIPIGGILTYVFAYRWPRNSARIGPGSVLAHNAALALWIALIYALAGLPGLIIYAGTVFVAGCIGVFMVYLQHNFEDTWWDRKPDLNPARAALQGSSALDLGWLWDLATGNIAYHDIHHFNANIPSYRLRACHKSLRQTYDVPTIGWGSALRSFQLKLWDEDAQRLIPFPSEPARSAQMQRL